METVKVIIEKGSDNRYSVVMDSCKFDFGLAGFGDTEKEAVEDFWECYEEEKGMCANEGKIAPALNFQFVKGEKRETNPLVRRRFLTTQG